VVDEVGSPNVKLLNDLYHMQIMEGNLIANLRKYIDSKRQTLSKEL
jgi:hydroxypyruvate isomerase